MKAIGREHHRPSLRSLINPQPPGPEFIPSSSNSSLQQLCNADIPARRNLPPLLPPLLSADHTPSPSAAPSRGDRGSPQPVLKLCGWCGTSSTSQWRVGPIDGSQEMATLCNACGINYRRARLKAKGRLDLDRLARAMGSKRPSIQKSLKRQRKLELSLQIRGTLRTQSQALHSPPHSYRDRGVTFESPSLPPIHTLFQTHAHSILPSVHSLL